jgi:hypothetical protein
MNIDLDAIEADAKAVAKTFGGEWSASADNVFLRGASGEIKSKLVDVRGWGWLTGTGGLCMKESDAASEQDGLARHIATMNPATTLALVEEVRRLREYHEANVEHARDALKDEEQIGPAPLLHFARSVIERDRLLKGSSE